MLIQSNNTNTQENTPRFKVERFNEVGAALEPRCYVTQDSSIDVVCHHCGRSMSMKNRHDKKDTVYRQRLAKKHKSIKQPSEEKPRWRKILTFLQAKLRLKNQEFTDLNLHIDFPIHCEDCDHYIGTSKVLVAVVILCLIVFTMLLVGQRISLFFYFGLLESLALIGLPLFYINYIINQRKLLSMGIPFPIKGRALSIEVKEELTGEVKLNLNKNGDIKAETDLSKCNGTITSSLPITSADIDRLEKFKSKFKQKTLSKIHYHFGFLMFQNVRAVKFENAEQHLFRNKLKPLIIKGKGLTSKWSPQKLPFSQDIIQTYQVVFGEKDDENKTPIQIVPTIISEGGKTGLALTVQVNPDIWTTNFFNSEVTIQELHVNVLQSPQDSKDQPENDGENVQVDEALAVSDEEPTQGDEAQSDKKWQPATIGKIQTASPPHVPLPEEYQDDSASEENQDQTTEGNQADSATEGNQADLTTKENEDRSKDKKVKKTQICWKKVKLAQPAENDLYEQLLDSDAAESNLNKLVPTKQFYVRFERGIDPSMRLKGHLIAHVNTTFSGIDKLQFFDPLGYKVNDVDYIKKIKSEIKVEFTLDLGSLYVTEHYSPKIDKIIREGSVIPDHRIVNTLIKYLIKDDTTYIQRVVENPAQTNQTNAKIQNRFWDIAGREYNGVYPIDFHIVLSGQQEYIDRDSPDRGQAKFDVSVNATVTSDEMEEEVDGVKDRIIDLISHASDELRGR
ncbi:MAG: hypothetical protein DWQ04_27530 [Chloroflexi bacterium]|nr:MAG: hypothetical protein DWQ04_27530 [Chloroflexota bacterium]